MRDQPLEPSIIVDSLDWGMGNLRQGNGRTFSPVRGWVDPEMAILNPHGWFRFSIANYLSTNFSSGDYHIQVKSDINAFTIFYPSCGLLLIFHENEIRHARHPTNQPSIRRLRGLSVFPEKNGIAPWRQFSQWASWRARERGPFKLPRTPNLLVLLLQWRLGTRTEIVFLNLFL